MTITFPTELLKEHPKLERIQKGMLVVALKDSDYEGLKGTITQVLYGDERETENASILDIIVDFEEGEFSSTDISHPHLNGTSISGVICSEDELGFLFNEEQRLFESINGRAVCPHCFTVIQALRELQTKELSWTFKEGKYITEEPIFDSESKRCDECNEVIEDAQEYFFSNY